MRTSLEGHNLAGWLAHCGGFCNASIDLHGTLPCDREGEFSVVALTDIAKGSVLLRIPAACTLRAAESTRTALIWRVAALTQIMELFWAPYLLLLPAEPSSLQVWTAEEFNLLSGTQIGNAVLAPVEHAPVERAAHVVRTRSVHLEDGSWILLPGIDSLNDAQGRAVAATTLTIDNCNCFEMKAGRHLRIGEEVTHCYSKCMDSAELLIQYGFVPPDHDSPRVFSVREIYAACTHIAALTTDENIHGGRASDFASHPRSKRFAATWRDPLSDELGLAILRLVYYANVGCSASETSAAASLAYVAESALKAYIGEPTCVCSLMNRRSDHRRVEAARRLRDAERAACIALRTEVKGLRKLGQASR